MPQKLWLGQLHCSNLDGVESAKVVRLDLCNCNWRCSTLAAPGAGLAATISILHRCSKACCGVSATRRMQRQAVRPSPRPLMLRSAASSLQCRLLLLLLRRKATRGLRLMQAHCLWQVTPSRNAGHCRGLLATCALSQWLQPRFLFISVPRSRGQGGPETDPNACCTRKTCPDPILAWTPNAALF